MTTPKKRTHRNNKSRTIAPERAKALLEELTVGTIEIRGITRRLMTLDSLAIAIIDKAFAAHAAATLDRKKRRGT